MEDETVNEFDISGIYTAPPKKIKLPPPPNPGGTTPPPNKPQKFWYVPKVHKMTKVLQDGRENG